MKINPEIVLFVNKHPILSSAVVTGAMITGAYIVKQVAPVVGKVLENANQNNKTVKFSIGEFCITTGENTSPVNDPEINEIPERTEE